MKEAIHILRYGTVGDKEHLFKARESFHYLAVNANSAAYVSGSIAQYVVECLVKPNRGYFIDPLTHAFQKNIYLLSSKNKNKEVRIKKSIEKLLEYYQEPASNVRNNIPIRITDFNNDSSDYQGFCKRVLDFQYNIIYDNLEERDIGKYVAYSLDVNLEDASQIRPKFLVAPYFHLDVYDKEFGEWLKINKKLITYAKHQGEAYLATPIFGQIVISRETLLSEEGLQAVIDSYSDSICDGFTVWVDGLDEHDASADELTQFVKLLKGLKSKSNKKTYNLYGSYFSVLLTHKSLNLLNGVSHGLEYGESRQVFPVGGGIPTSKYYMFPLHKRLDFTQAFYLLKHHNVLDLSQDNWGPATKYHNEVCKCSRCKKILKNEMINFMDFESTEFYEVATRYGVVRRKKASSETKRNCLYHYLNSKVREFSDVLKLTIEELLLNMEKERDNYIGCPEIDESALEYIDSWIKVLRSCL